MCPGFWSFSVKCWVCFSGTWFNLCVLGIDLRWPRPRLSPEAGCQQQQTLGNRAGAWRNLQPVQAILIFGVPTLDPYGSVLAWHSVVISGSMSTLTLDD